MENKTLEMRRFLRTIQEVRDALRGEEPVSDEQLRAWIQVAHRVRDGWLWVQLARLLARRRPADPTWAPVVLGWLLEAARRKSLWMDHLVYWALQGWSAALLHSALSLMCIQLHPRGFAEGLGKAVQAGSLKPEAIPDLWLESLLQASVNRPAGDRAVVRQVLRALREPGERPVHAPAGPSETTVVEDGRAPVAQSDRLRTETPFQVGRAIV